MRYGHWLAVAALVVGTGSRAAADYPAAIDATVGGKAVKMTLTGTAMRTKFIVNVYAIGSYVEAGAGARSAEALAMADCAKRLHLVMQRDVSGKDMAEAFRAAVRMNHAAPAFDSEVNTLCQYMTGTSLSKGDHVVLTHVPGVGLHCNVAGGGAPPVGGWTPTQLAAFQSAPLAPPGALGADRGCPRSVTIDNDANSRARPPAGPDSAR